MTDNHRGFWALLILATPIGMLSLGSIADVIGAVTGEANPRFLMSAAAVVVGIAGPALVPLAIAVRRRLTVDLGSRCSACGANRPTPHNAD
jgi:hypothetical protein